MSSPFQLVFLVSVYNILCYNLVFRTVMPTASPFPPPPHPLSFFSVCSLNARISSLLYKDLAIVQVTVYDKDDVSADDFIGTCVIPFHSLLSGT